MQGSLNRDGGARRQAHTFYRGSEAAFAVALVNEQ
jgi:hypothetical protein